MKDSTLKLQLIRDVTPEEYKWLQRTFKKGEVVYYYSGPTYGAIGNTGVPCSIDGNTPCFELPWDALDKGNYFGAKLPENLNGRRRFPILLLPTEGVEILRRMVGKSIDKCLLGIWRASIEAFFEDWNKLLRTKVTTLTDMLYMGFGGPLLVSCERNRTIVFNYDDLLGSVVLREFHLNIDDPGFFGALQSTIRLNQFISIKSAIDLSTEYDFIGKVIDEISVYRLPINFYIKPIRYDLLHECVLSFKVRDVGDVLFVCNIKGRADLNIGVSPWDMRVATWDRLDQDAVKHLTRVWSSNDVAA